MRAAVIGHGSAIRVLIGQKKAPTRVRLHKLYLSTLMQIELDRVAAKTICRPAFGGPVCEVEFTMSRLFDPLAMGSLELPNRIVMAPLTRARSGREAVPNELMATYYAQRASAGLIISEATGISREGLSWPNAPGLWDEAQVKGWKAVTKAVHREDGRIVAQLWHMGRLVHPSVSGLEPISSSKVTAPDYAHTYEGKKPYVEPRQASDQDIRRIVRTYAAAARNALRAGFDGVQIHGANGYLVDQFLRDGANYRTDAYGGSIENRIRFMSEVLEALGEAVGMDRVGIRFSPNIRSQGVDDSDPIRLFKAVAVRLEELKVPWIELREPRLETSAGVIPTAPVSPAMREHYSGRILINADSNWCDALRATVDGIADGVSIGRLFIANPDLVRRIALGAPLNDGDSTTFYAGDAKGYVDYATLEGARAA